MAEIKDARPGEFVRGVVCQKGSAEVRGAVSWAAKCCAEAEACAIWRGMVKE